MFILMLIMILSLILSMVIICLFYLISMKKKNEENKLSPFECGFLSLFNSRIPFSLQFYMISLVFVIFDVELILLFPYVSTFVMNYDFISFMIFMFFLILLTLGFLFEWNQKILEWQK